MAGQASIFITGATAFVGHYVVAELLRRGLHCIAMVRPGKEDVFRSLLDPLGVPAFSDRLSIVEGELPDRLPVEVPRKVDAIVHVAGVTRFAEDRQGEPKRTNVEGTRALLAWATAHDVKTFHFISTAYVCGQASERVGERIHPRPKIFHNAYEESKWEAERLCHEWAAREGRSLTIYRPSIVVGDWSTGRATQFRGFYILARATELLAKFAGDGDPAKKKSIRLRIPGRSEGQIDLVPVDFLANAIASIVADSRYHGGVYHLTHPNPPRNQDIKAWLEKYFDIGGGYFVDDERFDHDLDREDESERLFHDTVREAAPYWIEQLTFDRTRTTRTLEELGVRCPDFDAAYIARLIRYAQGVRWGRGGPKKSASPDKKYCSRYFENFLPEFVEQSRIATKTAITTTIRFVMIDVPGGQWTCRFESGRLVDVHRGENGQTEEMGYRAPMRVFWDAISGRVHPEVLFFEDGVELFGNIEGALKMASILHEFTKEFPCDRQRLQTYRPTASMAKPSLSA